MADETAPPPAGGQDPSLNDWDSSTQANAPDGAIRGGAAIALSKIGRQMLILLITIVLARLLTPAEFGAVAVVLAVVALGMVLQEAGLSSATIQREQVSTEAISTMFWISASLGLALTISFAALAHPLAAFFRQPDLVGLIQAMSLTFVLNGLVIQHRALLQRSMRFMTSARIDIGSALIGGLCAVAAAVAGFGYWALAAQMLVSDGLALLMLVTAVRWRITRPALTREVRGMLAFGSSLLGFSILVTVALNLQAIVIGRQAGPAAAGTYTRAYALASVPQGLLQTAAAHVAMPRLSRIHEGSDFATFYYRGVQLLSLVVLPVALGFAVFGDQIAVLVYGPQWGDVADLLQIFSIGLVTAPLLHSTGPVFIARGEPHRMLRWGIFGAFVLIVGTIIGLRWGTIGVAYSWSAAMVLLLVPGLAYAYRDTELTLARTGADGRRHLRRGDLCAASGMGGAAGDERIAGSAAAGARAEPHGGHLRRLVLFRVPSAAGDQASCRKACLKARAGQETETERVGLRHMRLLNLGCGEKTSDREGVVNIDWSAMLRLRSHPLRRAVVPLVLHGDRLARYRALPDNILVHDLSRGIPFDSNSVDAVYHSHTLEHLDRDVAVDMLNEVLRVLKPGGVHRIVVPDFELRCRSYVEHLDTCDADPTQQAAHSGYVSAILEQSVRREAHGTSQQRPLRRRVENLILGDARRRGHTHQWMYDRINLRSTLLDLGYSEAIRQDFDTSLIPDWNAYGLDLDDAGNQYRTDSLYMEAVK